jgi:4-hydroxybenzoate polyprenyltransferase
MDSILNDDPNFQPPAPIEKRAGISATNLCIIAVIGAAGFVVSLIPVIGVLGALAHLLAFFGYPFFLLYWLIRYKVLNRLNRRNSFNRQSHRNVLISLAIWLGTIAAKIILLSQTAAPN